MISSKVILVDCDGVLLDWEYSFAQWMARHGYEAQTGFGEVYKMDEKYNIDKAESKRLIRMFNESATIRKLPPLRDAIKYVKKLHEEHGYIFHAITSLSNDQYAQHLRTKNLIELFGPTAFEKYTYLDCGADKDEALSEYKDTNCYWVEDKPENANVGARLGLNALLMGHSYNVNDELEADVKRVANWKEIYEMVV